MKNSRRNLLMGGLFSIIIIILGAQSYFLYDLKQDIGNEINVLGNSLVVLDNKLNSQKQNLGNEISQLRNETSEAVKSLGGNIDALLKETSQSQKDIKKLTQDLEDLENVQIQASQDFSLIVEDVIKSVVSIKAGKSLGSGVFVSSNRLITNYHVVDEETQVTVTTVDGNNFQGTVIAYEENIDLAIIEIPNGNFEFLEFENMNNVKTGERVIAVGSPLGLSFSVTQGIISSKRRTGPNSLDIYLQTDTPINPGNSGGPLININKKIVAINTWKIAGVEGLGFSIRADVVEDIYSQI